MLLNRLTCVLLVSFLLASCGGDETDNSQTGSSTFTAAQDWCEASMGLRESSRAALLDISRAHVGFRLFGPTADWIALDERLQEILQNQTELNDVFLEDYAGAVGDMCVVTPSDMTPVYAEVTMLGTTALVKPGTDLPELPPETTHVIVDLRTLSATADVGAAASTALQADVTIAKRIMRKFNGFPSQDDGWTHYSVEELEEQVVIRGANTQELPSSFGPELSLRPRPQQQLVV